MNLKSEISHLRSETYLLRIKNNQLKSQYKSYRYSSGDEKPKISTLEKKKLILNPNKILDLYTIKDPCNTIFNCSKLSIEKTFFAILNNKLQTPSYSKPDLNDQIQIHPNTNFVSNNETSNVFKKHNTSFEKKNEDNSPKKKFSYCFTVNDFQMNAFKNTGHKFQEFCFDPIHYYSNFLNNESDKFTNSLLQYSNGSLPLFHYTIRNFNNYNSHLNSLAKQFQIFKDFRKLLFNTEDKIVDNMHRKLNCIFNDIRELSQNQFLANKILKYQQIFNNPMPLPKIFKVIDETCSKIMMSEHSVLILLDDYQKELFTMRHKDKEIRFEMDKGYLGKVFNEGLNIVIDQMEEDNEINKHICVKLGIIPKCILINPIYNSSNIIAAVVFINKKSNPKNTNNHKIRFDSNDEIVGNILSKQISSFLRISCFKTEFSEKEYKLKKAMGLVYKVTSLHKSFSVSIFISEIKKLFLTNHVQLIVIPDNDKDDKHRNKDTRKEDKSAFNNSGIIMSSTNYKKASIIENNLRGPKKILKINMDNESEITELTGLIAYVYKTKNSLYVVNRQNNTKYNPHFDIDTTSPIITYPIIINKIEKNQGIAQEEFKTEKVVIAVLQFEYLPRKFYFEKDAFLHNIHPFDLDLLEMISPNLGHYLLNK